MNIITIFAVCFCTIAVTLISDIISLAVDYGFYAYSLSLYLFIGFTIPGIVSIIVAVYFYNAYKKELEIHQDQKSKDNLDISVSSN